VRGGRIGVKNSCGLAKSRAKKKKKDRAGAKTSPDIKRGIALGRWTRDEKSGIGKNLSCRMNKL